MLGVETPLQVHWQNGPLPVVTETDSWHNLVAGLPYHAGSRYDNGVWRIDPATLLPQFDYIKPEYPYCPMLEYYWRDALHGLATHGTPHVVGARAPVYWYDTDSQMYVQIGNGPHLVLFKHRSGLNSGVFVLKPNEGIGLPRPQVEGAPVVVSFPIAGKDKEGKPVVYYSNQHDERKPPTFRHNVLAIRYMQPTPTELYGYVNSYIDRLAEFEARNGAPLQPGQAVFMDIDTCRFARTEP